MQGGSIMGDSTIYHSLHLGAIPYSGSHYGPGEGPVYLNNVDCIGSENNLTECSHSYFGDVASTCRAHFSDSSVSCVTGECNK